MRWNPIPADSGASTATAELRTQGLKKARKGGESVTTTRQLAIVIIGISARRNDALESAHHSFSFFAIFAPSYTFPFLQVPSLYPFHHLSLPTLHSLSVSASHVISRPALQSFDRAGIFAFSLLDTFPSEFSIFLPLIILYLFRQSL